MGKKKIIGGLLVAGAALSIASCKAVEDPSINKDPNDNPNGDEGQNEQDQPQNVKYTVTFNTNGGSIINSVEVNANGVITGVSAPTKEGYTFVGWYLDALLQDDFNLSSTITANLTLYAKWQINEYTVTYNTDGGSTVASQTVKYNDLLTKPEDPTKDGKKFAGWYSDSSYSTVYDFNSPVKGNITLYAKWVDEDKFNVSFNTNGGSAIASQEVAPNGKLNPVNNPTKEGYTFAGWYSDIDLTESFDIANTPITESITLYAKWTINQYTVTYEVNGGSAVESDKVDYNSVVVKPENPTKEGYTFKGWYTDSNLQTAYDFNTKVTDNLTLYAKWEINEYTVTYKVNGGSAVADETVQYNEVFTQPEDPTKEGYTFKGWYTDSNLQTAYDFNTKATDNLTLYAKWEINEYTITFNTNEGSEVVSQTVEYQGLVQKPANPTKEGYKFAGWYTDSQLTSVYDFNTKVTDNLTLYAKWVADSECVVTFETNGGTAIAPIELQKNNLITTAVETTKVGYTFVGWYSDEALETEFDIETQVITDDITLYAKWEINEYTVTYVENGGSDVADETVKYNEVFTRPAPPTYEGYKFAGWYLDEQFQEEYSFDTPATQNITLYAKWVADTTCVVTFETNGAGTIEAMELQVGDKVVVADPIKVGYTFIGWYSDSSFTNVFDIATMTVRGDMTLYAKWEINKYTVTFNTNGGTVIASQKVDYLGVVSEPSIPVYQGKVFEGWYIDANLTTPYDFQTQVSEDITLYAKWRDATKYDELTSDKENVIIAEDFNKYSATDQLEDFVSWTDKAGIVQTYGKGVSRNEATVQLGNGKAELVDNTSLGSVHFTATLGKEVNQGVVEGYLETTLISQGNSWTFFQLYGTDAVAASTDEVFGIRIDNGTLKYRIDKGSVVVPESTIAASNTTYKIYYKLDLATQKLTITINDQAFVTDLQTTITSVSGFKLVSSDNGSKRMTVDNVAVINYSYTLEEYATKLQNQLQAVYDSYNVGVNYPTIETQMQQALDTGKSAIASQETVELMQQAYDEAVANLADIVLTSQKEAKKQELENYVNKDLYQQNSVALDALIQAGKAAIDASTSFDQVQEAYNQATSQIDALETDEEILAREKDEAKQELASYKNSADYTINSEAYLSAIEAANQAIDNASTTEEVEAALQTGKDALDGIESDATIVANKALEAVNELNTYAEEKIAYLTSEAVEDLESYKAKINDAKILGTNSIKAQTTIDGINLALTQAKNNIDNIVSSAETTIEELKETVKSQISQYVDSTIAIYSDPEFVSQIESLESAYLQEVDAATTKDEVLSKYDEAISAIEGLIEDFNSSTNESIIKNGQVEVTEFAGLNEGAYVEWNKVNNATNYAIYLKGMDYTDYTKVDDKIVYIQQTSTNEYRADLMGLKAGTYNIEIVPIIGSAENRSASTICKVSVAAYDRSGYAHFNNTEGVGAYNDDGTLKDNAIVIYVTDENKDTVMSTIAELQQYMFNIPNEVSNSWGNKEASGIGWWLNNTQYTKAGSNTYSSNGKELGFYSVTENHPIVLRFVGTVTTPEGLTAYDSTDEGGSVGDNGHMARMKDLKNVTIEGVGFDAAIQGWGFHFICSDTTGERGRNFEVRNLTFTEYPEDAIGMEGVQEGNVITASVERCWIHHITFLPGYCANPAESDKAEGDGSCDFKRGQYYTLAYCYFEYCHKTNLIGSSDSSLQYNITMHHNIWYNCGSRIPLLRQANVHFYNNYIYADPNDDKASLSYVTSLRANCYMYAENNYYEGCKNVFDGKSGGAAKMYGNTLLGCFDDTSALSFTVDSRDAQVSSNCAYNGTSYANFDTNPELFYYNAQTGQSDCYLTDATTARNECVASSGSYYRTKLDKSSFSINSTSNKYNVEESIDLSSGSYTAQIGTNAQGIIYSTPGKEKFKGQGITFRLTDYATVKIAMTDSSGGLYDGHVVSASGEVMINGSGEAILAPGLYYVVSGEFDKETTVTSLTFTLYNSEELNQQRIDEYNNLVSLIPDSISYTDECYEAISNAKEAYTNLGSELQAQVDYTKVDSSYKTYISLGKAKVESLISAIGVVNENSGTAISTARSEYNSLIAKDSSVVISNYNVLVSAEAAFESYAVTSCINKINAIGTVTIDSKEAIEQARNEYDALSSTQKNQITNYQVLVDAEKEYETLVNIQNVIDLIDAADLTNVDSMKAALDAYNSLTTSEQEKITNTDKLSNIKVTYLVKLIDSIGEVTTSSGTTIVEAETIYNGLSQTEKTQVSNYSILVAAREAYDEILNQQIVCTFEGAPSNNLVTASGNYKKEAATIGGVSYTMGLKMESSTSVSFNTETERTLTLHVTPGQKIKVDNVSYDIPADGVLTITIKAGAHTITKDTTNTNLYALILS